MIQGDNKSSISPSLLLIPIYDIWISYLSPPTSPSVNRSTWYEMELSAEQYPDNEQDLGLGEMNFRCIGKRPGADEGVDVLAASRVGVLINTNWRERAAFQRSAFGRSTAGNDVVATIFIRIFFFFFPPFFFRFSPSRPFLIEGVLGSKNLFSES